MMKSSFEYNHIGNYFYSMWSFLQYVVIFAVPVWFSQKCGLKNIVITQLRTYHLFLKHLNIGIHSLSLSLLSALKYVFFFLFFFVSLSKYLELEFYKGKR